MIFLHDLDTDVKLAITHADMRTARFIKSLFGVENARAITMDVTEFDFTLRLIENGVYRSNQFYIILGGRRVRYTWGEVQAAAKEFNFTTDELIDLMVVKVHERIASDECAPVVDEVPPSVEETPSLRIVVAAAG